MSTEHRYSGNSTASDRSRRDLRQSSNNAATQLAHASRAPPPIIDGGHPQRDGSRGERPSDHTWRHENAPSAYQPYGSGPTVTNPAFAEERPGQRRYTGAGLATGGPPDGSQPPQRLPSLHGAAALPYATHLSSSSQVDLGGPGLPSHRGISATGFGPIAAQVPLPSLQSYGQSIPRPDSLQLQQQGFPPKSAFAPEDRYQPTAGPAYPPPNRIPSAQPGPPSRQSSGNSPTKRHPAWFVEEPDQQPKRGRYVSPPPPITPISGPSAAASRYSPPRQAMPPAHYAGVPLSPRQYPAQAGGPPFADSRVASHRASPVSLPPSDIQPARRAQRDTRSYARALVQPISHASLPPLSRSRPDDAIDPTGVFASVPRMQRGASRYAELEAQRLAREGPQEGWFAVGVVAPRDMHGWTKPEVDSYHTGYQDALYAVQEGTVGIGHARYKKPHLVQNVPELPRFERERMADPAYRAQGRPGEAHFPQSTAHQGHSRAPPPPLQHIMSPRTGSSDYYDGPGPARSGRFPTSAGHPYRPATGSSLPPPGGWAPDNPHYADIPRSAYYEGYQSGYGRGGSPAYSTSRPMRQLISCYPCRNRKLKCDGNSPCSQCLRRNGEEECKYANAVRRRGKGKKTARSEESQSEMSVELVERDAAMIKDERLSIAGSPVKEDGRRVLRLWRDERGGPHAEVRHEPREGTNIDRSPERTFEYQVPPPMQRRDTADSSSKRPQALLPYYQRGLPSMLRLGMSLPSGTDDSNSRSRREDGRSQQAQEGDGQREDGVGQASMSSSGRQADGDPTVDGLGFAERTRPTRIWETDGADQAHTANERMSATVSRPTSPTYAERMDVDRPPGGRDGESSYPTEN